MNMELRLLMGFAFGIIAIAMMIYIYQMPQPFPVDEGFVDSGRCGPEVGVTCPDGLRCMNGYCKSDVAPQLPALSDLPIRPARYEYPVPAPSVNVDGVMNCGTLD